MKVVSADKGIPAPRPSQGIAVARACALNAGVDSERSGPGRAIAPAHPAATLAPAHKDTHAHASSIDNALRIPPEQDRCSEVPTESPKGQSAGGAEGDRGKDRT